MILKKNCDDKNAQNANNDFYLDVLHTQKALKSKDVAFTHK